MVPVWTTHTHYWLWDSLTNWPNHGGPFFENPINVQEILRYAFLGGKLGDQAEAKADPAPANSVIHAHASPVVPGSTNGQSGLTYAERSEKERLLQRALPDAQAAATNWIHSNGMYGKPPSRFIRDITRILFDPNELASNRVTTLDKKWVGIICKEAIDAYPNNAQATSGAVRNIISTMCSEARVSLGYSKSKAQRVKRGSNSSATPTSVLKTPTQVYSDFGHANLVKKAIAEASHNQQLCLNWDSK